MPIFNQFEDPRLKRLQLFKGLETSLPNPMKAQETFLKVAVDAEQKTWAQTQANNWAVGSQLQAGDVLASVGAPASSPLLRGLFDLVDISNPAEEVARYLYENLAKPLVDYVLEEIIGVILDVLEEVFSPMIQMVGAIPVYGWIVEALWDVAMGIVSIVNMVKAQKADDPEAEYKAAGFSPEADTNVANAFILDRMRESVDWTRIFMPPGIGRNLTYGEKFWSAKLKGNMGRRILSAGRKEGWVGYIPGTGVIDQGWEIGPSAGIVRNLGTLLPSSRDMSTLCWSQVNGSNSKFNRLSRSSTSKEAWEKGTHPLKPSKNWGKNASPAMFTVDAESAFRTWQGYLFEFRMWLREGKTGMKESTRKKFVDGVGRQTYGWAKWDTPFNDKKEYDNFGINQSTPVKALRTLRQRQMAFLNRIDVAYVGPDYGVLQGAHSENIRKRWEANRKMLLQHPARCGVDLSSIPRSGGDNLQYRSAMEYALESCIPTHIGTLTSRPRSSFGPGGEPPPPGAPVITTSPARVKAVIKGEAEKHRRSKGKKGNLLIVGLGVGLLALASRKGK